MKRLILAAALVAITAASSDACSLRGRARAATSRSVSSVRTVAKSVVRGTVAAPCSNGRCPAPQAAAAAVVVPVAPAVKK